jgi:hypothetical protein
MSLYNLPQSNTISTSQLRLALISRKTEIMKLYKEFPHVFGDEFFQSSIAEIDSFLLYIDGSSKVQAIKDTEQNATAIEFTLDELKSKVADLPPDGYFRREGDSLWYHFICNDMKVVEQKYETIDMQLDGEWRSVASVDQVENLNLIGQELRYLVLA